MRAEVLGGQKLDAVRVLLVNERVAAALALHAAGEVRFLDGIGFRGVVRDRSRGAAGKVTLIVAGRRCGAGALTGAAGRSRAGVLVGAAAAW